MLILPGLIFTSGCATNPVTGKSELALVGKTQEVAMGQKAYAQSQQAQGGDLVTFPSVTSYVQRVANSIIKVSDRPGLPYEIVVLNNSVPNAWALPGGKMAINRGLLVEMENEAELAAVLAHEIVHAAARHGAKNMERGILLQSALIGAGVALSDNDYRDIALGGLNAAAVFGTMKYSRNAEYEADKYGVKYMVAAGYDPQGAVTLQQKFMAMKNEQNPSWLQGMLSSHPPSANRVSRNKELARRYPSGKIGYEEYQRAMAPLFRSEDAYKKHGEGVKALSKGNHALALELAQQAIQMEPREAHFYNLSSKAYAKQNKLNKALQEIDKALARNDNYFEFHLQKGQIEAARGNRNAARTSYLASNRLLPTATAHHGLGLMAQQNGNTRNAIAHFRVAAASETPAGRASSAMLSGMGQNSPQRVVRSQLILNQQGYLNVSVQNMSNTPINNLVVRVQVGHQSRNIRIPGTLPAGRSRTVPAGFGPYKNATQLNGQVTSQVISVSTVR